MINYIAKITLYVKDQDDAKKFWTQQMDFVVKLEQEMGPGMKWLEVGPANDGATTFVLYEKSLMLKQNPNTNVGHPSIILSTDDLTNAHEKMKDNNVQVGEIQTMPYGSMFHFFDQDGNMFLIREDK